MTMLRIGFIGAGRLARSLAPLIHNENHPVVGAYSRNASSAEDLAASCGVAKVFTDVAALVDAADLVFVTVPDDAIRLVAETTPWRSGQFVVHCSGATEVASLEPALMQGAMTGGFHPLQIFSDPASARERVRGSVAAIEGEGVLFEILEGLAKDLGMTPLRLPAGARVAYHLAGNFAASAMLALLKEAEDLWQLAGLPRETALPALLPLTLGTLKAAERVGLPSAVAGPVSRGDLVTLDKHLRVARKMPNGDHLYREILLRLLDLTRQTDRLDGSRLDSLRDLIAAPVGNDPAANQQS